MRTLLIAPNWIGDAVMTQPLANVLARQHPDSPIDAVAAPHIAPVMNAMPEIDTVLSMPLTRKSLQLGDRWRLAQVLRGRNYQRCYVLQNTFKSALAPWLAGIPERIGHRGEARYGLLNQIHQSGSSKEQLMVQFYGQLAWPANAPRPEKMPDPRLKIDPAVRTSVREKHLAAATAGFVVFCPGAEYGPAKRWPTRHFAMLARLIHERWPQLTMVCLGGPKDRGLGTEIKTLSALPVLNLAGETTLDEALAILSLASGVVSNDSGLMHVSAALNRPLVAVFGSSDPNHTPPLSPQASVQWLKLECAPCFARTCPLGHTSCLNDITPSMVLASLAQRIQIDAKQPPIAP